LVSLLRDRASGALPEEVVVEETPVEAPAAVAEPAAELPALPQPTSIREAADHTRIRQLVAQYREAVVSGSQTRARATEELIVREGASAAPFVDRAIAESATASVRAGLTRIRGRLSEPIIVTGPVQGPPLP
jgi:hypothetical protein